jgi:alginate O-acetyltransferase complex protein AlgJ
MSAHDPLPTGGAPREEVAQIEVGQTTVNPATVRVLLVFFLTTIFAVPIVEWFGTRAARQRGDTTAWAHLTNVPSQIRSQLAGTAAGDGLWRRTIAANRAVLAGLSGFERALENDSLLGQSLRPPAQLLMTGWLGAGNERVYPGERGWIFYRPDVEHVTGRGFLEPRELRRRIESVPEWTSPPEPDPRKAVVEFKGDLADRGIALIVMPVPLKPSVHPEKLSRRHDESSGVLQNPSFTAFIEDLRRAGVVVFDPAPVLARERAVGPQYLATDTHWRPEAVEAAADELARMLAAVPLPNAAAAPGYRIERVEVQNIGDTARMLDLPEGASLFPAETVWLRRVLNPDGAPWRSVRDADILLLGDSFSNIYSLESMGWGTSAGLAEQLSYTLGRSVDRLVQNDEGAFATRDMLQRDPGRLSGKRVVIYQFAARELSFGDWRIIRMRGAR